MKKYLTSCLSLLYLIIFCLYLIPGKINSQSFYWTRTNGPNDGTVNDVYKSADGKIYSGTWGGVFVSSNNGDYWNYIGLGNLNITSIAAANGYIYAGTDLQSNSPSNERGIYISSNNGASWQLSNLIYAGITDIYISNTGKIFASFYTNSFYDGYFSYSTNNGLTWIMLNQLTGIGCREFSPGPGNSLYVSAWLASMAYSTDDGTTWTVNANTMNGINSIDASVNGCIFGGSSEMLYKTTNNGLHWDSVNYYNIYRVSKVKSFANGFVFAGTQYDGVWRSSDFGVNWIGFWYPDSNITFVNCLEKINSDIWCGFNFGSLFRSSNNGNNWIEKATGLSCSNVYKILRLANGYILAGTYSGLHRSIDNGINWNRVGIDYKRIYAISQKPSGELFAFGVKIYKSIDNGLSWEAVNYPPYMQAYSSVCTLNGDIFFSTESNIYRSTNNGNSWQLCLYDNGQYFKLSRNNLGEIFAAGFNKLYKSTNNGNNWLVTYNGTESWMTKVVQDNNNNLYFGQGNYIHKSTNNGQLWTDIFTGLNLTIYDITVNSTGTLVLSSDQGVYFYNGSVFNALNTGLEVKFIIAMEFNSQGNLLAAAKNSGIYISNGPIGIHPVSSEIPEYYSLSQNYPNPFNPSTKIKFEIPAGSKVAQTFLSVHDMLGKEIAILVNEKLNPGTYEVDWNAANYPSGVYFYKLVSGGFSQTRKMVLIK